MPRPTVICLTPVRNEAWILDRFLRCASTWADHILVLDQNSTDGSREIARAHEKVVLLENPSSEYDEGSRQRILLEGARRIPGPRLLVALDADEILSANHLASAEWDRVLAAPPGTVIQFRWANLHPDLHSYWDAKFDGSWGFMDDGSEHTGTRIHSQRVPFPEGAPVLTLHEIRVLHYQYVNWSRMASKHRWYQCWERINDPSRRAVHVYRQYNHMHAIREAQIRELPREWIDAYERMGIDMLSVRDDAPYWWDRDIVTWIARYGPDTFRREVIWDIDWAALAGEFGIAAEPRSFRDPRGWFDRRVQQWLQATRRHGSNLGVRVVDKLLSVAGW